MSRSRFYRQSSFHDTPTSSDKNRTAINSRYQNFLQTRSLISLVNDNHVDNNLKEILVCVYLGSIVNNRPNNENMGIYRCLRYQFFIIVLFLSPHFNWFGTSSNLLYFINLA